MEGGFSVMKLVTGDMLWTNLTKIPHQYPYLSEDIVCDVVIVGGGITGALAAYYLTQAGIQTVLVDKNIIGYGSTRASTSIIQYEIDTDLVGLSAMVGEDDAVTCFKLCEKAVYDLQEVVNTLDDDCDFALQDCLYYTHNPSETKKIQKEYNKRKEHGFDVSFLDKNSASDKFSFPIEAGIYSTTGAARVDPYRLTQALISYSVQHGLKVYENTEVDKITPQDSNVYLETANSFNISANHVVIAAGYESLPYFQQKIADMYRTFTIVTEPIKTFDGWHKKCIIRDNEDPYTYLRTTGDNRIIIGGEDELIGSWSSKMSNLSQEDAASTSKYQRLEEKLIRYFPNIEGIKTAFKFSGLFGITHDGLPYIGEAAHMPRCYFSLGYGSNGILYAVLGGQLIKELCLDNHPKELSLFRFDR